MANEAGDRVRIAADLLHSALHPGDEVRGPRSDIPAKAAARFEEAIRLLGEAEDFLDPGFGEADLTEGKDRVQRASDELEFVQSEGHELPRDVGQARADALRKLDWITGRT